MTILDSKTNKMIPFEQNIVKSDELAKHGQNPSQSDIK